jgi:hypothetical protein
VLADLPWKPDDPEILRRWVSVWDKVDQRKMPPMPRKMTWLTAARFPGLGGFKNTISLDQLAAEKIGLQTRFPSLVPGTGTRVFRIRAEA